MTQDLTPAQEAAATTQAAHALVLAGPGSGKTRTLISRIGYLLSTGAKAADIVAITFTNAAAKEIAKRLADLGVQERLGYVGTLHGYALRGLQTHGHVLGYGPRISIIEPEDAEALMAATAKTLNVKVGPKLQKALETFPRGGRPRTPEEITVATFRTRMRQASLVDFDTILADWADIVGRTPLPGVHLIVDEFQDSGAVDFRIYRDTPAASRWYVGDPDQAIYSFRGGRLRNILDIAANPLFEVHTLEGNYRSGRAICQAAQALIERNKFRAAKSTVPMLQTTGYIIRVEFSTDLEEAAAIAQAVAKRIKAGENPNEMAVLARTNAAVHILADALRAIGVPVKEKKAPSLPKDWTRARLALELLANPDNRILGQRWLRMTNPAEAPEIERTANLASATSLAQWIHGLTRPQGVQDLPEALARLDVSFEAVEWIQAAANELVDPTLADVALVIAQAVGAEVEQGDGVTVTTFHASKGREWEFVALAALENEVIPGARALKDPAAIEEERRLFYVAMTRAKDTLILSRSRSRRQSWGRKDYAEAKPSLFLDELPR